ncbi:DNA alkylation repair protein [Paludibacterium paludis]|uniref:3-methyladenine DNA glycosylase AlkD n=1 Tax=Paludibacterium paludis TaxID=1225769 RepID=A0A918UBG4_9NEIS|nr:DNA alkylation repair protein [Paludibacterium paludis]GGY23710.1 hypothetical protein GCM10011289_29220 [Paludibacterium paludis]
MAKKMGKAQTVDPRVFCEAVRAELSALADDARAAPMRAYMKNRYPFFGIPTPRRRKAVAPLLKRLAGQNGAALLACAARLWEEPERECCYVAVDLLAKHTRQLHAGHLADILDLVQRNAWWDSVDGLAGVVGDILRGSDPELVDRVFDVCLAHPDKWVRRVALLHQLGWNEATSVERLFRGALRLGTETDVFIGKAVGWSLRDYAWHDPAAVREFVGRNVGRLSPLSVREALKNLD